MIYRTTLTALPQVLLTLLPPHLIYRLTGLPDYSHGLYLRFLLLSTASPDLPPHRDLPDYSHGSTSGFYFSLPPHLIYRLTVIYRTTLTALPQVLLTLLPPHLIYRLTVIYRTTLTASTSGFYSSLPPHLIYRLTVIYRTTLTALPQVLLTLLPPHLIYRLTGLPDYSHGLYLRFLLTHCLETAGEDIYTGTSSIDGSSKASLSASTRSHKSSPSL